MRHFIKDYKTVKTYNLDYADLDLPVDTLELLQFRDTLFNSNDKVLIKLAGSATQGELRRIKDILDMPTLPEPEFMKVVN
tara:strand:- start:38 stop:277 length:240 start_codon:yes stop_codon:yes gene_type:complete